MTDATGSAPPEPTDAAPTDAAPGGTSEADADTAVSGQIVGARRRATSENRSRSDSSNPADEFAGVPRVEGAVGVPDAYQRLWVPHRIAYIRTNHVDEPDDACPFCVAPTLPDEDALIVARGETAFVLLNLFPYNSGHLLVCPYRHVPLYDEATDAEVAEIAALTQTAMRVLRADSGADGFNIGLNQGRIAGAGVADHLHQHVVPRWRADANFFPIVAQTKALPVLLGDTRAALAAAWPASA